MSDNGSSKLSIALTGGSACGKSEVAGILRGEGVPVIDADALAHALLAPGHRVFEKVVQTFGKYYLTEEGVIDRRKLGRLVFKEPAARATLNGLMHPAIYEEVFAWISREQQTHDAAVAMIPLLYETGMEARFDCVISVAADENLMVQRMLARGWTEDDVRARIAAQWPVAEKARRADYVIWNNEDLPALKERVLNTWRAVMEGKEART